MDKTPTLKERIRQAGSAEELVRTVAGADFRELTGSDAALIRRRLASFDAPPQYRIAYLGNHTIEPLPDFVTARAAADGLAAGSWMGNFNQHFQDVLTETSPLRDFDPDLILLSLSMRELSPRIHEEFAAMSADEKQSEFTRICDHLNEWIGAAERATGATLLIANFAVPAYSAAGIADLKAADGETAFFMRLNLELMHMVEDSTRAYVLDLDRVLSRFGKDRAVNPQMYFLARMEWHERVLPHIAEEIYRYVTALLHRTKKCLVLDLDNTLWGGIVGEDGPDGVKIGTGDPVSEAYLAFQRDIQAIKERGIVLAVNSKNNREDVDEVFAVRPEMPIRLDDCAAAEINWQHKHENLKRIAATLNIGTDSLVFVDDNPVECSLVAEMLPEVKVIQLPGDPADFPGLLRRLAEFEKIRITAEDRDKSRQYVENRRRAETLDSVGSLDAYLESLATEVTIRAPDAKDAARIHQMFNKTNQFNVTTKRYTPADVDRFLAGNACDLRVIDVKDRFGDLGPVALYLVDTQGEEPVIDSFLMSCRAMGREVETAIMNRIKEDYLGARGFPALRAAFVPTRKNMPVKTYFEDQGFTVETEDESGAKSYRLTADQAAPIACAHVAVIVKE